jgi:hypothetical protein
VRFDPLPVMCDSRDVNDTAQYNVRLADGSEFGPAPMDLIVQWASEGRVPQEALLVPQDGGPVRSVLTEPRLVAIIQRGAPPIPRLRERLTPGSASSWAACSPSSGVSSSPG